MKTLTFILTSLMLCLSGRAQSLILDIEQIINRWAPSSENDTDAYIARVLELMGREPGSTRLAPLNTMPGRLQLAMLIAAMTCVETGCPPDAVPVSALNAGVILSGLGDPHLMPEWHK